MANKFLRKLDLTTQGATLVITAFDMYSSLVTRKERKKKIFDLVPPLNLNIDSDSRIEKMSMGELLASEVTKKSLTEFLIKKVIEHLKRQNIDFIVAENRQTFSSLSGQIVVDNNNHVMLRHF